MSIQECHIYLSQGLLLMSRSNNGGDISFKYHPVYIQQKVLTA